MKSISPRRDWREFGQPDRFFGAQAYSELGVYHNFRVKNVSWNVVIDIVFFMGSYFILERLLTFLHMLDFQNKISDFFVRSEKEIS